MGSASSSLWTLRASLAFSRPQSPHLENGEGATNKTLSEDFSEAINLLRLSWLLTDLLTHSKALCHLY